MKNKTLKRGAPKNHIRLFLTYMRKNLGEIPIPFWKEIVFELLTERNYNASQIAHRAGISKTIVYKLLTGVSQDLSHKNFRKLLRLYFAVCYDMRGKKLSCSKEK